MPTLPVYTKCSMLGCNNPKSKRNSFCMDHGGRDTFNSQKYNQTERYKQGSAKYNTKAWETLRQVQLSNHPLCAGCLASDVITSAEHIDHVFPWQQIGEQAFYINLFQSLCPSCHSSKTSLERKGIYRRYGKPSKDYSLQDYNKVFNDLLG